VAKKAVSSDEAILSALQKALAALPASLPLNAKDGLFPTSAPAKLLAESAITEGYLTRREVKGTKPKKGVEHGVLTEKGIRRVIEASSPKANLEALLPAVQALGNLSKMSPETLRLELTRAAETGVQALAVELNKASAKVTKAISDELARVAASAEQAIKAAFASFSGEAQRALAPSAVSEINSGSVLDALQQALERIKAPVIPDFAPAAGAAEASPPPSLSSPAILEGAIVDFVNASVREKTVGCQFDVLWEHLKKQQPNLTIGTFQDALRKVHDSRRLRLGGWNRMQDDIPQPQLALFISSKVMYYVHPAHPIG